MEYMRAPNTSLLQRLSIAKISTHRFHIQLWHRARARKRTDIPPAILQFLCNMPTYKTGGTSDECASHA